MASSDVKIKVVRHTLAALEAEPKKLTDFLQFFGAQMATGDCMNVDELVAHAADQDDPNNPLRLTFHQALARWDYATDAPWISGTAANTPERRKLVCRLLGLNAEQTALINASLPFYAAEHPTVLAADHLPWYTSDVETNGFYWKEYRKYLENSGDWSQEALLAFEESTRAVVQRLANPSQEEAFQAKGLAVGYVQSGKTANFTGVVARAADAGYRLIIILAGATDILRRQTQRRLDKEMIGRELLEDDYEDDAELSKFVSHGTRPSQLGYFDWQRLTGPNYDYQSLKRGIDALEFEKANPTLPFYRSENTSRAKARLIVIKKNSPVMKKVIGDLRRIRTRLQDIPALIVDDESDQSSLNTRRPDRERGPINAGIVQLLKILPRAQYVGYTATPFANVFVDPMQPEDLFPKDFLISLPRPPGYMGVSDFYDLEAKPKDWSSNKECFVREVEGDKLLPDYLQPAIDSFVLTGAIKLFRKSKKVRLRGLHHTMLVHMSHLKSDHAKHVEVVNRILQESDYRSGVSYERLQKLYETDFLPVTKARAPEMPLPSKFADLEPFIAEALGLFAAGGKRVLMVNSDTDGDTPDFNSGSVWKIIVGGTKLSRGYTIEGLTVSYYRRCARTADTLMQMGRWFGFRQGYGDLVRLFIGTKEPLKKGEVINLYDAFGAVCRDEEMFREQLKQYASMKDPRVLPIQVPPLVPSHFLPPTAANKMFNARVSYQNFKREWVERTMLPTKNAAKKNWSDFAGMVEGAAFTRDEIAFNVESDRNVYDVMWTIVEREKVLKFLNSYRWLGTNPHLSKREIDFIEGTGHRAPGIDDWLILAPQRRISRKEWECVVNGQKISVFERKRIDKGERVGVITEPQHRLLAEYAALGERKDKSKPPITALSVQGQNLYKKRRAVMLVYPLRTSEQDQVQPGYALFFPENQIATPLVFSVADPANRTAVTVQSRKLNA